MANKTIYIIASTFYPDLSNELIKGAKKELDDDHRINAVSALRTVIESLDLNNSTSED